MGISSWANIREEFNQLTSGYIYIHDKWMAASYIIVRGKEVSLKSLQEDQTFESLNPKKATGPDKIPGVIFKNINLELSAVLESYLTAAWRRNLS